MVKGRGPFSPGRLERILTKGLDRLQGSQRPWYRDLCDYYGVTPEQALKLGTRTSGRRPDLPGSATTHPVSGKTMEELWETGQRRTEAEIFSFYQEIGAWLAFRQVVHHRDNRFAYLLPCLKPENRFCEYGAGVAPVAFRAVERKRRPPHLITVVDVPSEHFTFGVWRLKRLVDEKKAPVEVSPVEILPGRLLLTGSFEVIAVLEVFEHLPNPLEVAHHLCDHLEPGGLLWENYVRLEDPRESDLESAQAQRGLVHRHLYQVCRLVQGRGPEAPGGGGTRCWQKR